nr:YggT family protein [Bacilli bacterium]
MLPMIDVGVSYLLEAYSLLLLARIILTWFPAVLESSIGRAIGRLTDPYLRIFQRFVPPISMGAGYLDLSPIVALIAYYFIERVVFSILGML